MKFFKGYILSGILMVIFFAGQGRPIIAQVIQESHEGHTHTEESLGVDLPAGKETLAEPKQKFAEMDPHKDAAPHQGDKNGHSDHGEEAEEGVLELDEEARGMIQLKTEKVGMREIKGHLKVYGKIAKDTENYSYVTFDGEGMIENIAVTLGEIVDEGTILFSIRKSDRSVEKIVSDRHGTVLSVFVKPSEEIDRLTSLLSLVNVDTMRATIDVYEKDLRLVEVGQKVVLRIAAFPEKKFYGEVVYISPQVDEHTQAIQVRIDVDNRNHLLRFGMFVAGELIYASGEKVLSVSKLAVQQLDGEDIVFIQERLGHFKRRDVVLGHSTEDFIEVKKGLIEGDVVVAQGSFYLKSEMAKESFGDGHNH